MPNTANIFRLFNELLLAMLGALLIRLSAAGRYVIPHRSPTWLALGAFLIYWGARAWLRAERRSRGAWAERLRGASLALVGGMMLAIAWAPLPHTAFLLVAAGSILVLRGLAGMALALRMP